MYVALGRDKIKLKKLLLFELCSLSRFFLYIRLLLGILAIYAPSIFQSVIGTLSFTPIAIMVNYSIVSSKQIDLTIVEKSWDRTQGLLYKRRSIHCDADGHTDFNNSLTLIALYHRMCSDFSFIFINQGFHLHKCWKLN